MSSSFLARPLLALDRIYRLIGGTVPKAIETDLPIQLVHDVSRMTEMGQPGMGLFIAGNDMVHGGAGVLEASFDPYTEVGYLYPNVVDIWVWCLTSWMTGSTGNFTNASLTLGYAPVGEYIVRRDRLVDYWTIGGQVAIYDQAVAPANLPYGYLHFSASHQPLATYPFLVPPGATLRIRSEATGVLTARIEGLFWAGPMGTLPPPTS